MNAVTFGDQRSNSNSSRKEQRNNGFLFLVTLSGGSRYLTCLINLSQKRNESLAVRDATKSRQRYMVQPAAMCMIPVCHCGWPLSVWAPFPTGAVGNYIQCGMALALCFSPSFICDPHRFTSQAQVLKSLILTQPHLKTRNKWTCLIPSLKIYLLSRQIPLFPRLGSVVDGLSPSQGRSLFNTGIHSLTPSFYPTPSLVHHSPSGQLSYFRIPKLEVLVVEDLCLPTSNDITLQNTVCIG